MAFERVAELVRRAAHDTGVFHALQSDPEKLRSTLHLTRAQMDALNSATAFPLRRSRSQPKQRPVLADQMRTGKSTLAIRRMAPKSTASIALQADVIAQDIPGSGGSLLPPEGSGQFVGSLAAYQIPPTPQAPTPSPVSPVRPSPSPVTPQVPSPRPVSPSPQGPFPAPVSPQRPTPVPGGPFPGPAGPVPQVVPQYPMYPVGPGPSTPSGPGPQGPSKPFSPTTPAGKLAEHGSGCDCCAITGMVSAVSITATTAITAITAIAALAGRKS